jgi:hypothetical protein
MSVGRYFFIITLISVLLTASCSANGSDKIVVYFSGCADAEIESDILYSKKGIEKFASVNDIDVEVNDVQDKCGYSFMSGESRKEINGSLTDYDLMQEAILFFEVK